MNSIHLVLIDFLYLPYATQKIKQCQLLKANKRNNFMIDLSAVTVSVYQSPLIFKNHGLPSIKMLHLG